MEIQQIVMDAAVKDDAAIVYYNNVSWVICIQILKWYLIFKSTKFILYFFAYVNTAKEVHLEIKNKIKFKLEPFFLGWWW